MSQLVSSIDLDCHRASPARLPDDWFPIVTRIDRDCDWIVERSLVRADGVILERCWASVGLLEKRFLSLRFALLRLLAIASGCAIWAYYIYCFVFHLLPVWIFSSFLSRLIIPVFFWFCGVCMCLWLVRKWPRSSDNWKVCLNRTKLTHHSKTTTKRLYCVSCASGWGEAWLEV